MVKIQEKELVLNEENNWTGSFTDLDEYKSGRKIVYTVEEVELTNGYTSEVTGDQEEALQ